MRFHVLTLFPGMFVSAFAEGIVRRAQDRGLIEIGVRDIRDYAHDRHRTVDDYPFGGGAGMLMKPEPLFEAVEATRASADIEESAPVVLLSPQGRTLTQRVVEELSQSGDILLICGRYEGVDERVRQHLATEEISLGDFVLSGGEPAALALIDAVVRLLPGVVGTPESVTEDSFASGLLEYPHYTRPRVWQDWAVPAVLLSGHHERIGAWRRDQAERATRERRPDLWARYASARKESK